MPRTAFVEDLAFTPLCMDAEELAGWRAQNDRSRHGNGIRARRPCEDCLLGFAAEMRALGRCNGETTRKPKRSRRTTTWPGAR